MLRLQVNRGLDGKFRKLEQLVENFQQEYVFGMATEIATRSPADTGTYMKQHHVGTTAVPQTVPATGPRRPPGEDPFGATHQSLVQPTIDRLVSEAPMDTTRLVFSNGAKHANKVEYGDPNSRNNKNGYAVYRSTAREHKRVAQEAEQRAKARNR